MKQILLATNNAGKIAEIKAILAGMPLEIITPSMLGLSLDVPEDGETYYENAYKKARAFALASGLPALADDSGLEVDHLNGAPGIHSHRFLSNPHATDADRCRYVISQLQGFPQPWRAAFHSEVVLFIQPENVIHAHGICPGRIIPEFRGTNGFGYDPIFLVDGSDSTMAELADDEKNRVSHRARALQAAMPPLADFSRR